MKKTLLLSVVASTMIMAGGDIAPVEPAVVVPAPVVAPAAVSNWKFNGQAVVYYQTDDVNLDGGGSTTLTGNWAGGDKFGLFERDSSAANVGLQLTATNSNLIGGIGFGAQLNGLGTLGLENSLVSNVMQFATTPTLDGTNAAGNLNGAYVSQLYLTYGIGNTSMKVGRQELPKALSPFAYSEDWNVFTNTFDAALVVNTDLPQTTLVGAWVRSANFNPNGWDNILTIAFTDEPGMNDFNKLNSNDGFWMLTAQNKSIENLTLTGSYYFADNYAANENAHILWADAQYNAGVVGIGLQGGTVMCDALTTNTKAFGAKVGGKFNIVNASVAYSHVNDSSLGMFQLGGNTSALYTDTIMNQITPFGLDNDSNKYVARADVDVLGGNISGVYAYTDLGNSWGAMDNVNEFDLTYSTKVINDLNVALSYVYADIDGMGDGSAIRAVARYNF